MIIYQIILPCSVNEHKEIFLKNNDDLKIIRIPHLEKFSKVSMKVNDVSYKQKYGFRLSTSEICNFITHRQVWEKFFDSGLPWCIVVENNVKLNLDMKTITEFVYNFHSDWDVFFPYDHMKIRKKEILKKNGGSLININIREFNKYEPYLLGYKHGSSIYFLSRTGAEKLLKIDEIRDRLDDTILMMSDAEKMNTYTSNVKWFKYSQIKDYNWPDRIRSILCVVLKQSSWAKKRIMKVRKILSIMSEIATDKKIDLVLQGGTHLGYIRNGGIMAWDDDVDIGIEESKCEVFLSELKKHNEYCFGKFVEPGTLVDYYKIWRVDGETIDDLSFTFPFVDLWVYNVTGNDLIFKNGIKCINSAKKDFLKVKFEGSEFRIPYNSIEVLNSRYIDWKNLIRVYTWSHLKEKHAFKYICVPVKVNKKGKILDEYNVYVEYNKKSADNGRRKR